jgi:3-hydroxybutyryl-CoA dehydratase
MSATVKHEITDEVVRAFAQISTDINPVHLDEDYARHSPFGKRIAHGLLLGSFISAVIGNRMPGPGTIYLAQNLSFMAPTYIGDKVSVSVTCTEIRSDKPIAKLQTRVHREDGTLLVDGEAVVKLLP